MQNYKNNLKLYAENPQRLARDQAQITTVSRGYATGEIEEREISLYALRTLSNAQLKAVWPHLPKPAPKPEPVTRSEEHNLWLPRRETQFVLGWVDIVLLVSGAALFGIGIGGVLLAAFIKCAA